MSDDQKPMKISLINDEYELEETTRRASAPRIDVAVVPHVGPNTTEVSTQSLKVAQPQVQDHVVSSRTALWNLKSVPQLPEYHPLERTAVFIDNVTPADISKRVSEVLRSLSIEAVYDDDKAKVKCLTPDGVDFRVRLYRGRDKYASGIIVEVQRRFGNSSTFYSDVTAILHAVQNKPIKSHGDMIPMVSDAEDDYEVDAPASLASFAKLLDAGLDSQYVAFQALVALTNPSKMGQKTANAVAQEILRAGNVVGARVFDHVLSSNPDDIYNLRTMAMTILTNAVVAVKGVIDMDLQERLRPVLLRELMGAEKSARMAQLSCQVVEQILDRDHDAAEFHAALEKAYESGMAHHAGLERQAKSCLDKLRAM